MVNITICDDSPAYGEILEHKIRTCMRDLDMEYTLSYFNDLNGLEEGIKKNQTDILFWTL